MKKIKLLVTLFAFSLAITGAFAFRAKAPAKKFLMEAYEKNPATQQCTIDKGQIDCDVIITAITCTLGGSQLYNNSCVPLYKQ